jgi:hypothetical protein
MSGVGYIRISLKLNAYFWLLNEIYWISLDFRRFSGIEADVSLLEAVADVDVCELAVLSNCDCSRPSERPDHVHCVGHSAFLGR